MTVATGGVWSGGAGSFSPSTTNLNATYTPTAAEIASGSVAITLTTTGVGGRTFAGVLVAPEVVSVVLRGGGQDLIEVETNAIEVDDAGRQQVEFHAGCGVPGIGATVDLDHGRNRARRAVEFLAYFRNEATFALVTEGDTDVGDQLAGKGEEGHGRTDV